VRLIVKNRVAKYTGAATTYAAVLVASATSTNCEFEPLFIQDNRGQGARLKRARWCSPRRASVMTRIAVADAAFEAVSVTLPG
jgi:hypothetical protein